MPKRSSQEKMEYYQYKLRKLAEKENRRRLMALETPTYQDNQWDANGSQHVDSNANHVQDTAPDLTPPPVPEDWLVSPNPEVQEERSPEHDAMHNTSASAALRAPVQNVTPESVINLDACTDPAEDTPSAPELDAELLTALGETTEEASKFGPNIHPTLADRWQPILRKGLPKETKDNLMKEYLVPENCPFLHAPKLNAEISAAIMEMARSRDKKMETAQQQLGIGISAINKALTLLLTGDDKVQAIKQLSDSCRILTDLHFYQTKTRIKVITPSLAKSFHKVIQDSERDDTLFGNTLPDKMKASKAIERQGMQIKKTAPTSSKGAASTSAGTSSGPRANYQYQGNWQASSRATRRTGGGGGRGGQRKPAPAGINRATPQPQSRVVGQSKPRSLTQQ